MEFSGLIDIVLNIVKRNNSRPFLRPQAKCFLFSFSIVDFQLEHCDKGLRK